MSEVQIPLSEQESFKSFEEAYHSVQGTRTSMVMKFKSYTGPSYGIDDLFSVADEAIVKAWNDWDPSMSKFNTYVQNHIQWGIWNFLNAMNSTFKTNAVTTYELTQEGDSYKEIKERGLTKSKEFNDLHELDGSEQAKDRFNRDLFNEYVRFETSKRRPFKLATASNFQTQDADDFDIMETAVGTPFAEKSWIEDLNMTEAEVELEITKLDRDKRRVAEALLNGETISDLAKEFGVSKIAFMQMFAPETSGTRGKAKISRKQARLAHAKKQRALKLAQINEKSANEA